MFYLFTLWVNYMIQELYLNKAVKKIKLLPKKRKEKTKNLRKQMEYLFVYGAKWGEIKEKGTTKR